MLSSASISNGGLETTSRVVPENLANATWRRALGRAYLFAMKMNESPRPFPLRTLMLCFTIWLIATEVLVFDQVKFNAKAELLDQAARALRGPQILVPTERPSNLLSDAEIQRL
jgi:hypothetical protein